MPIIDLNLETPSARRLCSRCRQQNDVNFEALKLGVANPSIPAAGNLDLIKLPECACGVQEYVQRTEFDNPSPHAQVVNHLARKLKTLGQVETSLAARIAEEPAVPAPAMGLSAAIAQTRKDYGL